MFRCFVAVAAAFLAILTASGCQQVSPSAPLHCSHLGLYDKLADDPACLDVASDDAYVMTKDEIDSHGVWNTNWLEDANEPLDTYGPKVREQSPLDVRQYPYVNIATLRMKDRELVGITVSDRCPVNAWDGNPQANLGCMSRPVYMAPMVSRQEAARLLSEDVVRQLEEKAQQQRIEVITFHLNVIQPDAIQPDGSSGEDYPL